MAKKDKSKVIKRSVSFSPEAYAILAPLARKIGNFSGAVNLVVLEYEELVGRPTAGVITEAGRQALEEESTPTKD